MFSAASLLILSPAIVGAFLLAERIQASRRQRKAIAATIDRYQQQLDSLALAPADHEFIKSSFIPRLERSIKQAQCYQSAFSLGSTLPIWLSFFTSSITVLANGVFSGLAVWGLAVIGLLSAGQAGWILLNSFTQPGQRYRDSAALQHQLEECLNELLSPTPEIPLEDQFIQFCKEFKQIRSMAHDANIKWIEDAQRASKSIIEQTSEELNRSRSEYRSHYERKAGVIAVEQSKAIELELEPGVDDLFATVGEGGPAEHIATHADDEVVRIGDTGMTPAQFIEMSMGGEDDDTAVFLNQGWVINEP